MFIALTVLIGVQILTAAVCAYFTIPYISHNLSDD